MAEGKEAGKEKETPTPVEGSASQKKVEAPPSRVEEGVETHDDGLPAGVRYELKRLRSDRRGLNEENERLRDENERLLEETRTKETPPEEPEHAYAPQGATKEEVRDMVREENKTQRKEDEKKDAFDYILSQEDVTTDDELSEVVTVMKDVGLDKFARVEPLNAAQLGVQEWRRRKGDGKASPHDKEGAKDTLSGTRVGGGSGKRTYKRAEINAMSDKEYEDNREDMLAAQKDGRIT